METNEEKVEIDAEDIKDFEEPESILDDAGEDTTDWKAEALKRDGMARRFQTKLKKFKELQDKAKADAEAKAKADSENKQPQDKKEFDYAEKAFLKSSGIKPSEYPFVLEKMQSTGKSLDELLESKYFQNELQEKRELDASTEAVPKGTPRGGGATRDEVEYWIAKGELPPSDQPELRRKVVNARLEVEKNKSKFTDTPVV